MRHLIFSDIQGNLKAMTDFVRGIEGLSRHNSFCLGDIINNGESYDENRVVELLKNIKDVVVIKGNHDILESDKEYKISEENKNYLRNLPTYKRMGDFFLFHSSLKKPGKRLFEPHDLTEEYDFIKQDTPYFLYGHTHRKLVYDIRARKNKEINTKIPFNEGDVLCINPGGIGLYYNQPQTFAILDTSKKK